MKKCLIMIASYADGYLDGFLKSVKIHTTDVDYEIQVVDNNPDQEKLDKYVIPICKKHNVLLHLDKNISGFSDALVTGVKINKSKSKYILYIHTDIKLIKGWLSEMIACYERHKNEGCRLVGCLVKTFDNEWQDDIVGLGKKEDIIGKDFLLKNNYLIGCYLRERSTLNEFNWDKNFLRAYSDDYDICNQVRYWGYQCWVAGKSVIYHK